MLDAQIDASIVIFNEEEWIKDKLLHHIVYTQSSN